MDQDNSGEIHDSTNDQSLVPPVSPAEQGFQAPPPMAPQQGFQAPPPIAPITGGQPYMPQKSGSKVWIIVIACVLGVLVLFGVVAAVIGVAVTSVIDENKSKLDSQALSSFTDRLVLRAAETKSRKKMQNYPAQDTFKDLMMEFHEQKLISLTDIKKLSGASGMALENSNDYRQGSAAWESSDEVCIFTGPSDPKDLIGLLSHRPRQGEGEVAVTFTYSLKYMQKALAGSDPDFPAKIPVIFGGQKQAQLMTLAEIEAHCLKEDGKVVKLHGKAASELYGSYPFHFVSPE